MQQRFDKLAEWLRWQESLHSQAIDLGLDRVSRVYQRLSIKTIAKTVVTVAGTNGKGSAVSLLETLFRTAGYRTGSYTSPHLLRYNERICIAGLPVDDAELVEAFTAVDQARGDITLTYFEFGTLAAFYLFARQPLDVVLLEVGMGGRLDATNIIDADAALITAIGLDHQDWLGTTRDEIAREKAGILRPGKIAVCGDRDPPPVLFQESERLGVELHRLGVEFDYSLADTAWRWRGNGATFTGLPLPEVCNAAQLENASAALQLAVLIRDTLPFSAEHLANALRAYIPPGRCQIIGRNPEIRLDVAHNPQAAAALAEVLSRGGPQTTHMVFGILADKDAAGIIGCFAPLVNHWYFGVPDCQRALQLSDLRRISGEASLTSTYFYPTIAEAFARALQAAQTSDRIIITGSFYTVAEVMGARKTGIFV